MDRRGRFDPAARNDSDTAEQRRRRRAVMNDVRRVIERDARIAAAAEELSTAAEVALAAIDAGPTHVNGEVLSALRAALAKYREASRASLSSPPPPTPQRRTT